MPLALAPALPLALCLPFALPLALTLAQDSLFAAKPCPDIAYALLDSLKVWQWLLLLGVLAEDFAVFREQCGKFIM